MCADVHVALDTLRTQMSVIIAVLVGLLACAVAMPQAPGPVMLVEFTFENGFTNTAAGWPGTPGLPVPTEPGPIVARSDDPTNHALSMQTYTPDGIAFNVKESFPPNNIDVSMSTEQTISLWYHWPSGSDHQCRPIQEVQHAFALIPPDLISPNWGVVVSQGSDVNISGAWVHLARVIKIGETGKAYFNGISKAESPSPMTSDDLRWDLTIGYFCENITVDNIRVYSYALNVTQVQALYAEGLPTLSPTASPTVAPTGAPTASPTAAPTGAPTRAPTAAPTAAPTVSGGGATAAVEANSTAAVAVSVGDADAGTALTAEFTLATGDASVTVVPYAGAAEFDAVAAGAGCNDTDAALSASGRVVRRFTLTTSVSVYASFAVANDTLFHGYTRDRHVRLCYNQSWMRTDEVCAALWTAASVGSVRFDAARATSHARTGNTTVVAAWLCHATPFVIFDPASSRFVCDTGHYGCDCSMTSWWIDDAAYVAMVAIGSALGTAGLLWWNLADPSARPDYFHIGSKDSTEFVSYDDGEYGLRAAARARGCNGACTAYFGSGATLFGIGVFLVSAAAHWLRPAATRDPASEAFSDWTESLGWATVGWTLGSRALATFLLSGRLAGRCCAARDAPGTLSVARLLWSFSLWFPGFAISKSAGYGGGVLYTAFAVLMFPAPCIYRTAAARTKRFLATVDALAFGSLTAFFYVISPCQ